MSQIDVVKRGRRGAEPFQHDKLHASILASCRSVRTPDAVAHQAATHVCEVVISWTDDKPEITSEDIRRRATQALEKSHPDAAYLYQHYHVIL